MDINREEGFVVWIPIVVGDSTPYRFGFRFCLFSGGVRRRSAVWGYLSAYFFASWTIPTEEISGSFNSCRWIEISAVLWAWCRFCLWFPVPSSKTSSQLWYLWWIVAVSQFIPIAHEPFWWHFHWLLFQKVLQPSSSFIAATSVLTSTELAPQSFRWVLTTMRMIFWL